MAVENVKRILQDFLAPRLERLEGKIDALDHRLNSLEREIDARFNAVDKRLDSLERQIITAIDIHERLAAVEAKISR